MEHVKTRIYRDTLSGRNYYLVGKAMGAEGLPPSHPNHRYFIQWQGNGAGAGSISEVAAGGSRFPDTVVKVAQGLMDNPEISSTPSG